MQRKLFGSILGLLAALGFTAVIALAAPNTGLMGSAAFAPSIGEVQTAPVTQTAGVSNTGQTKIAAALAKRFGVTISDVQAVRDQGFGWGEVVKVFAFAKASAGKATTVDIIAMRTSGMGWGEIRKSLGLTPQDIKPGGVALGSKKSDAAAPGKPGSNKNKSKDTVVKDADDDKSKDTEEADDGTANVPCKGTNQTVKVTGVGKCKGTNQEVNSTPNNGKQNPKANDRVDGKGHGK
jgi:hypothetical protein